MNRCTMSASPAPRAPRALSCSDQNGARNILKVFWAHAYGEARPKYLARPTKGGSGATPSSDVPPAPPTQVRVCVRGQRVCLCVCACVCVVRAQGRTCHMGGAVGVSEVKAGEWVSGGGQRKR